MNYKDNFSFLQQENVYLSEIDKFNALAYNWWNKDGEFKLLHSMNPLRLDYILNRSGGLFGKKILDVGCGGGLLAEGMASEGAEVTGIDISLSTIMVARSHALSSGLNIKYIQHTVENHSKNHIGCYDVITCMEMLEHVPNPASIVHSCARLISPGGDVFFSTINRNFQAWFMVICSAEYLLSIVPYGTHDVNKFIKPAELLNWVDETDLCEQHIIGMQYNPVCEKFILNNNIKLNYILHTKYII
ncbi:bifunctional 2-polyprenyl-6-hydroxyphenol methylase/3-demethylubiquinol 3-O-methyltransferase UbiG [Candidatus Palibaumannia cicadellinicola]|uniref:Ubiquinone biosynthesis O-methyltransferase n=1 Tax=Candidatus Palibaumannia cicadellinicola TaxID=186490 RepID=A0A0K2BL53_9GAMM|nr:bifunctional 2-polyprenyl-6-hydroxyphenol methylase/3-demethylubiquinol 3-O-methyltransferase UbiG [Candidatus Baumannia cicadellinicola]AKZ65929.1 3-demethylubiquinol 3-O-methyltransferase [Candidatus Baumannia cicadellinicola]